MLVGLKLILGGQTKGDNILATTHVLYPTISKYHSAIRHPQIAFKNLDPILVAGKPVEKAANSQGFKDLWSAAGGFACVFKYETFHPKKLWAVRCFLQSTSSVATHYSKVSSRLPNIPCSSYFVECSFLAQGIRVDGNLYPTVKMEWAEGKDLRTFIRDNLNNKNKLDLLAQAWVKLSKDLADNGIAHGDLQHGNITVDDSNGVNLKLIDYDSLYFSVDGNGIIDEIKGLDGYQHKLRKKLQNQCIQIDFFPQLVIYLSIVAIAEKPQLWNQYNLNNTERLLFSVPDFQNPDQAQVFQVLSQLSPNIARLADELKKICKLTDFSKIPSLDTVLTPPVTKWDPSQVKKPSLNTVLTPLFTKWDPSQVKKPAVSPAQNPPTKQSNPGGGKTTSQPKTLIQKINTSQTSLTQQTQKGSYPILVKTIAVVSTVIATTLGGFCYYQYQQINQVKQQIEKIRLDKKILPPKGNKPSLSVELQNMMNVVKGKESFLYQDIEQLVSRIESQKSDFEKDINNWKSRVDKLEGENGSLQEKSDQLQSKVNEYEKYTYVNFCNKTSSKTISAGFAYWDGKGLRSRGWWNIEPGKCMEVSLDQNYRGNLYIHGDYNRGESSWGSGDTSFCVDIVGPFAIENSDKVSCSGGNLRQVTMSELAVSPGTNNWNFNDKDSTGKG
ncbi:MAG TPA: hypothetical protein DGO89_12880 [Microcoleaceae bacterium UBA9251]|jgi:Mn2+-dependent serine/threonine protein kinase|nr:hypothetical protein [Microcoleaceae cyanobacterium UBA9251]